MDRREFLKLAAGAVVGGWQAPAPARARERARDWQALAGNLAGALVRPADAGYEEARKLHNIRFDAIRPEALAFCENAADVRECLVFARRERVPLALRAGGHSYAGWSTGPGLVIDVSRIKSVAIDAASKRATVGAGAQSIDVSSLLAVQGLAIPLGSCPTVGVAGLALGGGVSVVSRAHGLTCDTLRSVDLVLASGKTVTCDERRHPDLFWACRGGGGGNFGVATSFTFQAHPTADVTRMKLEWEWTHAAEVLKSWQRWAPVAPDEAWSYCQFATNATGPVPKVRVLIVFLGSQGDLEPLVAGLLGAVRAEPVRSVETQAYPAAMLTLAGCTMWDECHPRGTPGGKLDREAYSAKSDFFDRRLSSAACEAVIHQVEAGHAAAVVGGATFDAFGGAINRVRPDATAFRHRGALFNAQYLGFTSGEGAASGEVESRALAWLRGFRRAMRPSASGGAYVNYADPELSGWRKAYYGANYARLARTKARYDPAGLFKLPQGIGPG